MTDTTNQVNTFGGMFGRRTHREMLKQERALQAAGHGVVSDVHFDLRHDALVPGKWDFPGIISANLIGHDGFFVSTPLPATGLLAGVTELLLERAQAARCVILHPGDFVKIADAEVHAIPEADPFASEPDRIAALVHFAVKRADGKIEEAGGGWVLPVGCMTFAGDIEERALALLRKRTKRMAQDAPDAEDPEMAAVLDLMDRVGDKVTTFIEALWEQQEKLEGEGLLKGLSLLGGPPHDVDAVINLAVYYGYRQGLLEASREMKPSALAKLKHVSDAKKAGKANAIVERTDFAKDYWERFPTASMYEVHQQFMLKYNLTSDQCAASSFNRSIKPLIPPTSKSHASQRP